LCHYATAKFNQGKITWWEEDEQIFTVNHPFINFYAPFASWLLLRKKIRVFGNWFDRMVHSKESFLAWTLFFEKGGQSACLPASKPVKEGH